jgi:hypothetical protein
MNEQRVWLADPLFNTNSLLKEYPPLRYASLLEQKVLIAVAGIANVKSDG